jgi:hypothetical protein
MVYSGIVVKWHGSYGFIKPDKNAGLNDTEIFVHLRDRKAWTSVKFIHPAGQIWKRPKVGDRVMFDNIIEKSGKRCPEATDWSLQKNIVKPQAIRFSKRT